MENLMNFHNSRFLVIDECPAVAIHATTGNKALLNNHKQSLTEMILRDQNRPSVIMWSLANEPRLGDPKSKDYFMELRKHVLSLDKSRPVTAVLNGGMDNHAEPALDIVHLNRY